METTNINILYDRVYALYRVSSLGQVEKDDIPAYCGGQRPLMRI